MKTDTPKTTYLADYSPPEFSVTDSRLEIQLGFENTVIKASHQVKRMAGTSTPLALDCELMAIESVHINGSPVAGDTYRVADNHLVIEDVPDQFDLTIVNRIDPSANTALSGLYKSSDMLCTQCEAEGFRRITPAIDRPDNLAIYTVKLVGSKRDFPVLLCNGNLVDEGEMENGCHWSTWHDPFPKPTYLFAIVAGQLSCLKDSFTTCNGREVMLRFYARNDDISKCHHAMASLKRSMQWDEQVYGREYDLDLFNVVAVEDFNMGAMENKSLNVFNTKYVLADSSMATDTDFENVESVIGHEYFHNWSGNRVTCRDWFQLSLKEGFTVFRDQEFSADMGSRGVKRIDDVNIMRTHQFREDAGPMAHPIRPDSYQEINNFYTVTIYNKGAEVVRMVHTLLGADLFRAGTDRYFSDYDGKAVTTDDFIDAMERASGHDLAQFRNWYSQAGTPVVKAASVYDSETRTYELTLAQHCPPTPGQPDKKPFVIPVTASLYDVQGNRIKLEGGVEETTLVLDSPEQVFHFGNIETEPVPSLLRRFSAPVDLEIDLDDSQLGLLMHHDNDPFNRWESGQKLFLKQLLSDIKKYSENSPRTDNPELQKLIRSLLTSNHEDQAFLARLMTLPAISYISEQTSPIDPRAVEISLRNLKRSIAEFCRHELEACYRECHSKNTGAPSPEESAARSLRDTCLGYLVSLDDLPAWKLCRTQMDNSRCMTDSSSALTLISASSDPDREDILEQFYQEWQAEPLVVDKWLRAQAIVPEARTLEIVRNLTRHSGFDQTNPNKVFSLILGFTHGNPFCFHAEDGTGYEFAREWVEILDPKNPQVSARLVSAFNNWSKYQPELSARMQQVLLDLDRISGLSADVKEIVSKALK